MCKDTFLASCNHIRLSEEIAIVKQVICLRWIRWKWAAIVLGALMLFSAATTAYFTRRNLEFVAKAEPAVRAPLNLDAARTLQGVWGWRADYQQSCSQNPQTISVSPDGKSVSLDYAKPYRGPTALRICGGFVTA